MRNLLILFLLITGLNSFSQSEKHFGAYENKTEFENGISIEYELFLNPNGTFLFHFYQDQICYTDDDRAKGKWTVENDIIIFKVNNKVDIDDMHKLDFDNTKAKMNNGILSFYDSEILWINGIELEKK